MSDEMKVSFVVEITGCFAEKDKICPYCQSCFPKGNYCAKAPNGKEYQIALDNRYKLTESCPMVKEQFEALI